MSLVSKASRFAVAAMSVSVIVGSIVGVISSAVDRYLSIVRGSRCRRGPTGACLYSGTCISRHACWEGHGREAAHPLGVALVPGGATMTTRVGARRWFALRRVCSAGGALERALWGDEGGAYGGSCAWAWWQWAEWSKMRLGFAASGRHCGGVIQNPSELDGFGRIRANSRRLRRILDHRTGHRAADSDRHGGRRWRRAPCGAPCALEHGGRAGRPSPSA